MLTDFRTYIKARIAEVDSTLVENQFPFTNENIPRVSYDKAYHIQYGDIISDLSRSYFYLDTFPISIEFFKKGFTSPKDAIDELLDTVETIRAKISAPEDSLSQEYIKKIWSDGISLRGPDGNQNFIIIRINFNAMILASNNRSQT